MNRLKSCTLFLFIFTHLLVFSFDVESQQIDLSSFPFIDIYLHIPFDLLEDLTNLPLEEIQIFENQKQLQIEDVSIGEKIIGKIIQPRHFVFLADRSPSMLGDPIRTVRKSLTLFVDNLREDDQAAIVTLSGNVQILLKLTEDKNKIRDAISTVKIGSRGSPVYDGIARALHILKTSGLSGRKMVIVLSNGEDTNSKMNFSKILKEASDSNIPIYTVGFVSKSTGGQNTNSRLAQLETISKVSGGGYFYAEDIEKFINAFRQPREKAYAEVCIRVRSLQKWPVIERKNHIQIQFGQYKAENEYLLDESVIKRSHNYLREKGKARYNHILMITGSVFGFVLVVCLFIFWLRNRPERLFRREVHGTLHQLEKAIAPSLDHGWKRFIGDLTLSDTPQLSPIKLEQMLLSVKASKNDPYSPWLLQVDLQKEEAIFMSNILLDFSKKLDSAWYPQILAQLSTLSRLIDENIDYGSQGLNDISYWEDWWGKAKSKEEKQKITGEAEQFKKHIAKQSNNIRLKGSREIQNRIENIAKNIRYKKGKKAIFVTKSLKDKPIRIEGEILEASVNRIMFRTSTAATIENILCSGPVVAILTQFKDFIESEMLARMGLLYIVVDTRLLEDGNHEITVQLIKNLDDIDKRATEELMNMLSRISK